MSWQQAYGGDVLLCYKKIEKKPNYSQETALSLEQS